MADFRSAAVPYDAGDMGTMPSTQAPDDRLRVEATPQDFGGQIGAATQQLGGQLGQIGDKLTDLAIEKQHQVTDTLANQKVDGFFDSVDQLVDGPQGYMARKGQDATAGYDNYLQQARQAAIDAMPTQIGRNMVDQLTRRTYDMLVETMGRHRDQQADVAQDQSTDALLKSQSDFAASLAGNSGGNPDATANVNRAIQDGRDTISYFAQGRGVPDDLRDQKLEAFEGQTVRGAVNVMANRGNLDGAQSLLAQRGRLMDQTSFDAATADLQLAKARQAAGVETPALVQAVLRAEETGLRSTAAPANLVADASSDNSQLRQGDATNLTSSSSTLTDAKGNPVIDPNTDKPYPIPPGMDIVNNVARGRAIAGFTSPLGVTVDGVPLDLRGASMAYWFPHGHEMDYQRLNGGTKPFLEQYRNVSNYNFGAVAGAAGYTIEQTLNAAGVYNQYFGKTNSGDTKYHIGTDAVKNITQGWDDTINNKWGPSKSGPQ